MATAQAASAPSSNAANTAALIARLTRDQAPELEQVLTFTANTTQSTPTAIRTDRKIKAILFQFRGRITNAATGPTYLASSPLLGANNSSLAFRLIQQITVRGQHLRYGAQNPIQMRGEIIAEYIAALYPSWQPMVKVSVNGAAPQINPALSAVSAQTNDIDFVLPIPMFPPNIAANDVPFYSIHGPDWPGNLYIDVQFADGTALASANPPVSFTAYGSASGSPIVNICTERPLLGKDLMGVVSPVITLRQGFTNQPTTAVQGAGGAATKLLDAVIGKDTTRFFVKTGTQGASQTANVVSYASYLDSIVTRLFFQLDNRVLRFQPANGNTLMQDYQGRKTGRQQQIGYQFIDFVSTDDTSSSANPLAAFPSSQLTASRKFEVDADVTAAANQLCEVIQEMTLGSPGLG